MEEWPQPSAGALTGLLRQALPGESLDPDDVARLCEAGSAVLAAPGDAGAVVVRTDHRGDHTGAGILAVAVAPERRREGWGRRLVDAAVDWAFDHGAREVVAGGLPPWFLWPGIDVRWTAALCLFEDAGFQATGAALNLACPTSLAVPAPQGHQVREVEAGGRLAAAVTALARDRFPATTWAEEVDRSAALGTCHAAVDTASGTVVGFACHSVNRAGWFGPTAVSPEARGRGLGTALLAASLGDLRRRGWDTAEICWIGPVGFYVKAAGASVSRTFRTAVRRRRPGTG